MKLGDELGFLTPNPLLAEVRDIVGDMGALEPEEKLCCKGVVCDPIPWNISDFDHSMGDDSLKDFEEPIEALCAKEMADLCSVTNNVIEYDNNNNNNNNVVKDICVDDGVAVTSLGQILFGQSRTRRDPVRVDMEIVLAEEVVSEGFDLALVGEDSNIVRRKSAEELKTDNICSVIADNDEESSIVSYESTEESKTGNALADNAEESNIVSYGSVEVSKMDNGTTHSAGESNNVSNKTDKPCSVIVGTVEESSIVSNESSGESKTGNTTADSVEESNIVGNDSTEGSKNGNAIADSARKSSIVSNKTDNLSNVIDGNAAKSTEELKTDNLCSIDTESAQNNDFGHFQDLKDGMIHRESSFSIAGPLSGLITYSGPIAYSGSCSLRSDSSTTSTRSFAFPVLQAEWSSSPVRMRAADRRKHRSCWRQGLLCCRF